MSIVLFYPSDDFVSTYLLLLSDLSSIITSSGGHLQTPWLGQFPSLSCSHLHDNKFSQHHVSFLVRVSKTEILHVFVYFFDKCLSSHKTVSCPRTPAVAGFALHWVISPQYNAWHVGETQCVLIYWIMNEWPGAATGCHYYKVVNRLRKSS